jgi:rsbT antagonist protein RsbS
MADATRIPIIKLHDNLIASIQVALTDQQVKRLKEDVTRQIEHTGATGLVLDVSGIDLMDSYISRAIRDIGLIARLMGVETVMCGLDPMIAMTLVEMDLDMTTVRSALNLEDAIDMLTLRVESGRESAEAALAADEDAM